MTSRLAVAALSLALALGGGRVAWGAQSVNGYQIETDATHFNFNSGDFTMPHKVRFFRPGTDATGNSASGNSKRGVATLLGDVVVHDSGTAPEVGGAGSYSGSGPATLTCDQLDIDSRARVYTAIGHVHFAQGTRTGTAERGVLDRASGLLHLSGGVRLTDGGSTLSANTIDYNLNTRDAEVHGAPAVITEPQQAPPPARTAPRAAPKPTPRKKP